MDAAVLEADISEALGHVSGPMKQPKKPQKVQEHVSKISKCEDEGYSPETPQVKQTVTDVEADVSGVLRASRDNGEHRTWPKMYHER